ncbi:MAG: hypothetical protein HY924_07090 [Elusimicrobia bacterium]|nr:hypothetical protein [Elusimicrobiota bacterium]
MSIYYGDMEGAYPASLEALTIGQKYLPSIPRVETIEHGRRAGVVIYGAEICREAGIDDGRSRDSGGWGFVHAPGSG